ncbi:phage terminase large subunit-like protein [Frigoribacterium sp. PhB107]|nr:phage terminase large subunit-like protein [Frigoribacterium sp. PhB107]
MTTTPSSPTTSRPSRGRGRADRPKRYGSVVPRIWTPPLRTLTPETSLGFDCIEFADWVRDRLEQIAAADPEQADVLEIVPRLLEWQRWVLIHALELLDGPDLIFRFRTILLLVSRQNGKTVILIYLLLWRLFQDGARTIVGTAQSLDIAEEAWDAVRQVAEAIPELSNDVKKIRTANGRQAIILDTNQRYKIAAANRRGGRGLSGDHVVLDELREHQSWDSWASVSKTTLARKRAQVWGVSNAGDSLSVVLRHLRGVALAALGIDEMHDTPAGDVDDLVDEDGEELEVDIDESALGIFEYSAAPDAPMDDRDAWAQANPSMGHTIPEAAIAAALATDPEHVFLTEVMCRFVNTAASGPFPNRSWEATRAEKVTRDTDRPATYCVDTSWNRQMTHVALAFWDTDGRRRVEIAASRAGTEWVIPWLLSPERKIEPEFVTLQTRGAPVSSLVPDFENAGIELVEWGGPDLSRASGVIFDAVRRAVDEDAPEVVITHGNQPVLDLAATTAVMKPLSDGWTIDRQKSPQDAAPLLAVMGALWLLNTNPEPTGSAYDDEDAGVLVF